MRRLIAGGVAVWAATAAADEIGINTHVAPDDVYAAAADLGVGWVRIDANWLQHEPAPGRYDWGALDQVVAAARGRDLRVFMTIAYTPPWASEGDADGAPQNDVPRPGTYEAFVEATVRRYRDDVTHYGLWNEPNLEQFWAGSVETYVDRVVLPGAAAVRRACPACVVLGPDLAGLNGWQGWLRTTLQRAPDAFDIVTHHTYAKAQSVRAQWLCDDLAHAIDIGPDAVCLYKPGLRQILDDAGFDGEVWLTETGYQADPWDDAAEQRKQTAQYREILRLQLEKPWWTNTFFYEILDCRPIQPDCPIDGFGITRRVAGPDDTWQDNFFLKPAYVFLREELRTNPAWRAPDDRPRLEVPSRADGRPDGDLSDWAGGGCVELDRYESAGGMRDGAQDLGARVCAAWAPGALWLAADVGDDRHDNDRPEDALWQADSLQLALDADGDGAPGQGYDDDDREVAVALVGDATRVFAHHGALAGAEAVVRRAGARTRYEVRVPLAGLAPGRTLRASFLVNDADGAGREGFLEWTPGIGREKAPARFGALVLGDAPAPPPPDGGVAPPEDAAAPPADAAPLADAAPAPADAALNDAETATDAAPTDAAPTDASPSDATPPDGGAGRRVDGGGAPHGGGGEGGGGCATAGGRGAPLLLALLALRRRRRR